MKLSLKDYEGALMDFDKANIIERNDATNLKIQGCLKRKLEDYQGAFLNFNEAKVLQRNNVHTMEVMQQL